MNFVVFEVPFTSSFIFSKVPAQDMLRATYVSRPKDKKSTRRWHGDKKTCYAMICCCVPKIYHALCEMTRTKTRRQTSRQTIWYMFLRSRYYGAKLRASYTVQSRNYTKRRARDLSVAMDSWICLTAAIMAMLELSLLTAEPTPTPAAPWMNKDEVCRNE
jgi:hypothetical protein